MATFATAQREVEQRTARPGRILLSVLQSADVVNDEEQWALQRCMDVHADAEE
jgi:hypothetical protein